MKRIYMHNLTDECLKKSSMILMNTTKKHINEQKSEILHQEIFNWILVFEAKSKLRITEQGLNKDKGVIDRNGRFVVKLYILMIKSWNYLFMKMVE